MKEAKYKYTAQTGIGRADFIYRPLINVVIGSESKSSTFKALVDSGTEITIMDTQIADLLRISPEGKDRGSLSGIGPPVDGFLAPVSIQVEGFEDVFNFRVLFIENLQKNFDVILGQQDFFRNFDVSFEKRNNVFYLERAPTPDEPSSV